LNFRVGLAIPFLLAVLLSPACSSMRPVKLEEAERVRLHQAKADRLAVFSAWNMEGRLAVSNEVDGGSGQFRWAKDADGMRMDFHGALGRGAWKLEAGEQGAELILADGTVHDADSVDQLVRQEVGWEIPVENLSWWIRGLATPGRFRKRDIDGEGNVSKLLQDGWTIEYGRYRVFEGVSLPVKLTAYRGKWKVKLAIRSWDLAETVVD
jgi:outer membrane lipoprotein LolB